MHILEKNPSLKTAMELSEALNSLDDFHGTFEEREMLELRIWRLTLEEVGLLGITINDNDFKKNGFLLEDHLLHDSLFYIYCQVYDERAKSTHLKCRFDAVLQALPHMYAYWK